MDNVDLTKLTKLEALKQLAERVNKDFASKDALETVDGKVTKLNTTISELQSNVTELQEAGYQTSSDVESAVTNGINDWANQLTPEDKKVNTFKELVDYVAAHGKEVDGMLADILANKNGLAALKELVGELPEDDLDAEDIVDYITKAITKAVGDIDLSEFVDADDVDGAIDSKLEDYYNKNYIDTTYVIASNTEVEEMLNDVFGTAEE